MKFILSLFASIVRHTLTFGGGWLADHGYATADKVQTGVGAAMALGGVLWSFWEKTKKRTEPGGAFNPNASILMGEKVYHRPPIDPYLDTR